MKSYPPPSIFVLVCSLIVSRDAFCPWTWAASRRVNHILFIYFWYTLVITLDVCVIILWSLRIGWLFFSTVFNRRAIYRNVCFLSAHHLRLMVKLGSRKPVKAHKLGSCLHSIDRPKSVCIHCVNEVFGSVRVFRVVNFFRIYTVDKTSYGGFA